MAYGNADYSQMWSATVLADLRRTSVGLALTSQQWTQPWVDGQTQVHIPDPKWEPADTSDDTTEGVKVVSRNRGGNWATARKGDQAVTQFSRSGGWSVADTIDWEDLLELPWPVAEDTRQFQAYAIRRYVDDTILSLIFASVPAAKTSALGTSGTDTISISEPYQSAGSIGALLVEAIEAYMLDLKIANAIDSSESMGGLGAPYCMMSPQVFKALRKYLRDEKFSWDTLTSDTLTTMTLLGGGPFMGRLFGCDIMASNAPGLAAATASASWNVYFSLPNVHIANVRPSLTQILSPGENQVSEKPAWLARSVGEYGHLAHAKFVGLQRQYTLDAVA